MQKSRHLTGSLHFAVSFVAGFTKLTHDEAGKEAENDPAIVTLSKPRYKRADSLAFAGTLEQKHADAWCGVQIISLMSGDVAHWIRFDGFVAELSGICVLQGVKNQLTPGLNSHEIRDFITIENPSWNT